jgi:hypothetical protein
MGQNQRFIARSFAVGSALLAVVGVTCAYMRWY